MAPTTDDELDFVSDYSDDYGVPEGDMSSLEVANMVGEGAHERESPPADAQQDEAAQTLDEPAERQHQPPQPRMLILFDLNGACNSPDHRVNCS